MPRGSPQLERNQRIVEMRKSGLLPREIAKRLGISKNVVIGVTNRAGMSQPGLSAQCCLSGAENPRGMAKLSEDDVRNIRQRYRANCRKDGGSAIARDYGVSAAAISDIMTGRHWGHVQ